MVKFLEQLYESEVMLQKVNHLVYVTYPVLQDKKILFKMLENIKTAVVKCINCILQYEHFYKRIRLTNDQAENFRTFKIKCASTYNISLDEIKEILGLFEIVKKHKNSTFEFRKQEKIILISSDNRPKILVFEDVKKYLELAKVILSKTKQQIRNYY